jgi:hypothetical protein
MADETFNAKLKEAIETAVEKAKEMGEDLNQPEEEETDELGFQPDAPDGRVAGSADADGEEAK